MIFEDTSGNNKVFLLRSIIKNFEINRIEAAIYQARSYAKLNNDVLNEVFFDGIIDDGELMRSIGLTDTIKANTETAFDYFDKDKNHDIYEYDLETEKRLTIIKRKLSDFIAEMLLLETDDLSAIFDK